MPIHSFLKKINLFIYLFSAALGLHCCTQAFSSCGKQGLLFVAVHVLLIACCGAQAPGRVGFSSCGFWAELLRSMWDLPGPELEPMFPALAGEFLTTVPPGKSPIHSCLLQLFIILMRCRWIPPSSPSTCPQSSLAIGCHISTFLPRFL